MKLNLGIVSNCYFKKPQNGYFFTDLEIGGGGGFFIINLTSLSPVLAWPQFMCSKGGLKHQFIYFTFKSKCIIMPQVSFCYFFLSTWRQRPWLMQLLLLCTSQHSMAFK